MEMRRLTKLNELNISFFQTPLGFVVAIIGVFLGESSYVTTSSLQADFVCVILARWRDEGGVEEIVGFESNWGKGGSEGINKYDFYSMWILQDKWNLWTRWFLKTVCKT